MDMDMVVKYYMEVRSLASSFVVISQHRWKIIDVKLYIDNIKLSGY